MYSNDFALRKRTGTELDAFRWRIDRFMPIFPSMSNIRGLTNFVTEIRNCKTEEAVEKRVNKELAKIRSKFGSGKCSGYDMKKYVWKIVYMFMLGVNVEFGHMEAVQLITSSKYSEKNAGHIACTLMFNENNDVLRLIIQTMKKDLQNAPEEVQCLALATISNVGGEEFAESLAGDVQKLLLSRTSRNFVRKKAALALLRLFRKYPDIISPESIAQPLATVFDDHNLGVVTSVASLIIALISRDPRPFENLIPIALKHLKRLVGKEVGKGYLYYQTACPWLQVKLLRMFTYFPPPSDKSQAIALGEVLASVLKETEVTKSVNKNNSDYSILFEAVEVIIHINMHGLELLFQQTLALLARFIAVKEPNIRYLGLECMTKFCMIPGALELVRPHLSTIQYSLKQSDISIRRRALDLMFALCDEETAPQVVKQLLAFLETSDYAIKEEMVLKIAILAERFARDNKWYLDTILTLISLAGDYVSQDILYRAVQIVSLDEDVQAYAAKVVFDQLHHLTAHDALVSVGGYLLGEYGHLLEDGEASGRTQFELLHRRFPVVPDTIKAILLTSYMKLANTFPDIRSRVEDVFRKHQLYIDQEIQQRSLEYLAMSTSTEHELVSQVWEMMPPFTERESVLPKLLKKQRSKSADRDVWNQSEENIEAMERLDEEVGIDEEEEEIEEDVQNEEDDFIGLDAPSLPEQKISSVKQLLMEESGIFYECDFLQVGCKMKLSGDSNLKLILYFGNKSDDDITEIELSTPGKVFTVKRKPVDAFTVSAKQQVMQMFLWTCHSPFPASPRGNLSFNWKNERFNVPVQLPLSICKFFSPLLLSPPQFMQEWKDQTEQSVFEIVSPEAEAANGDTFRSKIAPGISMATIEGMDRNPANVVLAADFHYFSVSGQQAKSSPLFLRIETGIPGGAIKVTCRSNSSLVNMSIETLFQFLFDDSQ